MDLTAECLETEADECVSRSDIPELWVQAEAFFWKGKSHHRAMGGLSRELRELSRRYSVYPRALVDHCSNKCIDEGPTREL